MSPDKLLHKIQLQINDLAPRLEVFVEESIQPTSEDCDALLKELTLLQENLVIYRYLKQNKELSPSFNIHARVSEAQANPPAAPPPAPAPEPLVETNTKESPVVETELKEVIIESVTVETRIPAKSIAMAINDKFRFINELFSQNPTEFNIAIEQLNVVKSWQEAETYLAGLQNVYGWNDSRDIVKHFYTVVKKRFE